MSRASSALLRWAPPLVLALTVLQLAVAQWVPGIERFEGKAFGARLVLYPVLMLVVPATWWWRHRHRTAIPSAAFTLVMLPFLIDVTGNSLDLYDAVTWWDDLNHLVNWALLLTGLGLLLGPTVRPRWALGLMITGLGALLAIGWELGEWFTFIRHSTELDNAYEDTLGDEALGSLGALLAGVVVVRVLGRRDATATRRRR